MDRTQMVKPHSQKGGFFLMESSAPPDKEDPLSAGECDSGLKGNLTRRKDCS